ncbi:LAME_0D04566g1_1 [Lachancea meyersii CBS 8951]|uniref:LAME_0D04566g1_1 n=1 Tax=Lachancea meyersii CBS 8951 TaxID=1266667 RepID=A0A1G4J858_9SACH|nr:LAME_0D04566g1_1 [Lachancea meyersii CBS 8951]
MFQSYDRDSFFCENDVGNGIKRDFQCYNETGSNKQTQCSKRLKKCEELQSNVSQWPDKARSLSPVAPLIDNTLEAIAMSARSNTSTSHESSPYVEVEDYILEGYGSPLINGSYHSRLSLENITPVNYCLYDMEAEEFDESEYGGVSDGKTLVDTPEPQQDVEMME